MDFFISSLRFGFPTLCEVSTGSALTSFLMGTASGVGGDFERDSLSNLEGLDLDRVFTGGLCLEVEGLDRDSSEDFELSDDLEP